MEHVFFFFSMQFERVMHLGTINCQFSITLKPHYSYRDKCTVSSTCTVYRGDIPTDQLTINSIVIVFDKKKKNHMYVPTRKVRSIKYIVLIIIYYQFS